MDFIFTLLIYNSSESLYGHWWPHIRNAGTSGTLEAIDNVTNGLIDEFGYSHLDI